MRENVKIRIKQDLYEARRRLLTQLMQILPDGMGEYRSFCQFSTKNTPYFLQPQNQNCLDLLKFSNYN
jgi:hypothetical protein